MLSADSLFPVNLIKYLGRNSKCFVTTLYETLKWLYLAWLTGMQSWARIFGNASLRWWRGVILQMPRLEKQVGIAKFPGLGIRSLNFGANRSFFTKKRSGLSDSLTIAHYFWATWANRSWSLIRPEQPERLTHFAQKEWADLLLFSKLQKNCTKCKTHTIFSIFFSKLRIFCEWKRKWAICTKKPSDSLICSFVLSDLSKLLTFAHLSLATWAICSQ